MNSQKQGFRTAALEVRAGKKISEDRLKAIASGLPLVISTTTETVA
jgi:hypothetical protein